MELNGETAKITNTDGEFLSSASKQSNVIVKYVCATKKANARSANRHINNNKAKHVAETQFGRNAKQRRTHNR